MKGGLFEVKSKRRIECEKNRMEGLKVKQKKFIYIVIVILSISLFLSACGGGNPTGINDNLVYKTYTNNDFSYKYPADWENSYTDPVLDSLEDMIMDFPGLYYSSGAVVIGNDQRRFLISALEFPGSSIIQEDLEEFIGGFMEGIKYSNPNVSFSEISNLTIDNNPAKKVVYIQPFENYSIKADVIATYEGTTFYLIVYGCKESNYNSTLGLFSEMRDSIVLYD